MNRRKRQLTGVHFRTSAGHSQARISCYAQLYDSKIFKCKYVDADACADVRSRSGPPPESSVAGAKAARPPADPSKDDFVTSLAKRLVRVFSSLCVFCKDQTLCKLNSASVYTAAFLI